MITVEAAFSPALRSPRFCQYKREASIRQKTRNSQVPNSMLAPKKRSLSSSIPFPRSPRAESNRPRRSLTLCLATSGGAPVVPPRESGSSRRLSPEGSLHQLVSARLSCIATAESRIPRDRLANGKEDSIPIGTRHNGRVEAERFPSHLCRHTVVDDLRIPDPPQAYASASTRPWTACYEHRRDKVLV
ncbi:hypothetical protein R1flu_022473 [Riccia fluitans]|uniref:Uncharacterized protein n=1 Tax=Riccia fluitans TaxID=41844 RepID=A0ABD1XSA9_9MARC